MIAIVNGTRYDAKYIKIESQKDQKIGWEDSTKQEGDVLTADEERTKKMGNHGANTIRNDLDLSGKVRPGIGQWQSVCTWHCLEMPSNIKMWKIQK